MVGSLYLTAPWDFCPDEKTNAIDILIFSFRSGLALRELLDHHSLVTSQHPITKTSFKAMSVIVTTNQDCNFICEAQGISDGICERIL